MIQVAIFDMDGVIIDSHPVHKLAWRKFLESMGRSVTDSELEFILDGRKREDILRFFLGELTPDELTDYGVKKDDFFARYADCLQLVDGVVEFIAELNQRGIRMAVATSASRYRVDRMLSQFKIDQYFSVVITGNDVKEGKPNPAVFKAACERLQGFPSASVVFEDAVSGVRGAKAAGMHCMGVANAAHARLLSAAGADYVVPNFVGVTVERLYQVMQKRSLANSAGYP
jgi:beta-phosphoglucomutase